jgi:hypothetical protein
MKSAAAAPLKERNAADLNESREWLWLSAMALERWFI